MARSYEPPSVARRVRLAGLAFDTLSSDVGPAVG
jgi:hypothetical protein